MNLRHSLAPARRSRWILATLLCGLALLGSGSLRASADEKAGGEAKPAAAVSDKDYVIGVDDVISISAVGIDEVTQTVTVLSDGKIQVNNVKTPIVAEGLTLEQLKDKIAKGLDYLYNDLLLTVSIKESRSRTVTILGAKQSGQFSLRKGMRVSALIALGGGLPAKTKLVIGSLIRNKTEKIKLNILKIVSENSDPDADMLLQANDTIVLDVIEEAPPPAVSVLGQVMKPGSFLLPLDGSPVNIVRAIADSGGPTEKASLMRVTVQRPGQTTTLNLYPVLVEGKSDAPEGAFLLKNGDVILVPELDTKFTVLGQVNKAGSYTIPEGKTLTVNEALAQAGGAVQQAELRKAQLVRVINGKPNYATINLQDVTKNAGVLVQPNDILYVPMRGRQVSIIEMLNPLFILGGLGFRPL